MPTKYNLQLLNKIIERCKYFTSLDHKDCIKRVSYSSFASVTKLPCLSQGDKCPRAEFFTMEEAILQIEEQEKLEVARSLLRDSSLMRGKGGAHETV